jgi:hypothetical protein
MYNRDAMSSRKPPNRRCLQLLLVLLLLAVQGATLAHQLGHLNGEHARTCAICSIGSSPGTVATDAQSALPGIENAATPAPLNTLEPRSRPLGPAAPRAPPQLQ